ncbi:MAG TPA: hypothetical protein VKE22_07345 [Haliangiales bacterium]|nr:hypothetical protein [Haliangiales bacterium]
MGLGIHYPDLTPPPGWTHVRLGLQVRLIPPGESPATSPTSIVVSPLVPRQPNIPPPEKLIEEAIFYEAREHFEVQEQKGPSSVKAASGLTGVSYEVVGYPRPVYPRERRVYVMYADALCYYGVSYLAQEDQFGLHDKLFWAVAKSVRPFQGAVVKPDLTSPLGIYHD